jgi:hypothetical protein
MADIEQKTRDELTEAVEKIEEQNADAKKILRSLGNYETNITVPGSTYSIVIAFVGDILKKEETIIDLTLEGKYTEATIILRNLMEECYNMIYLVENSGKWKDFIEYKEYREGLVYGEVEDPPESIFNKRFEQILEEIDEKKMYRFYRALSQETHPSLQQLRDNVADMESFPKLDISREFDKRRAGAILYGTSQHVDKVYWRALNKVIQFVDSVPELPRKFKHRRDENVDFWEDLYTDLDLGKVS